MRNLIFSLLLFAGTAQASICDSKLVDFAGGAAAGTAATGLIAGDSMLIIATSAGSAAAVMPAVAPIIVIGAGLTTAAYAGVKGTCAFTHEDDRGKTDADYAWEKIKGVYKSAVDHIFN